MSIVRKAARACSCIVVLLLLGVMSVPLVSSVNSSNFLDTNEPDYLQASSSDFSTYFGGSDYDDATRVAFDEDGNTLLIGNTQSDDFPVTEDAIQSFYGGGDWDAIFAKFAENGSLVFATYLGGIGYEHVTTITTDSQGNIVVAGVTFSSTFPTTNDAYQSTYGGSGDGFLMKMSPSGELLYSTFFGGDGEDWIYGMEFDESDNYMFSGFTSSSGMATTGAYQTSLSGSHDAFVSKMNSAGDTMLLFSYIGGTDRDQAWFMTVDSSYNFVLSGMTQSDDYPTTNGAYQETYGTNDDAMLTKILENGTDLVFSSYLGGGNEEAGIGLDVDSNDNILLTGYTESSNFPVNNALEPTFKGGTADIFVSKFSSNGENVFVTFFGGNRTDRAWGAKFNTDDNIVFIGRTVSYDYPVVDAPQSIKNNDYDGCATVLSQDGQTVIQSTFIGGSREDIVEDVAVDTDGSIVVSGRTMSDDFPTTSGAYQENRTGSADLFVCHNVFTREPLTPTAPTTIPTPPPIDHGFIWIGPWVILSGIVVVILIAIVRRR
ncbi:MAG: SBBP repeat-containing protein [Candidatus Thorarchaeota archaeon]